MNTPDAKAYLNVNGQPDILSFELRIDIHALSQLDTSWVLREMEATLVSAVIDPHAVIDVFNVDHQPSYNHGHECIYSIAGGRGRCGIGDPDRAPRRRPGHRSGTAL